MEMSFLARIKAMAVDPRLKLAVLDTKGRGPLSLDPKQSFKILKFKYRGAPFILLTPRTTAFLTPMLTTYRRLSFQHLRGQH